MGLRHSPTWQDFVICWIGSRGAFGGHDPSWRSEFGGDIYLQNGSHSCVNLPVEVACLAPPLAPGVTTITIDAGKYAHYTSAQKTVTITVHSPPTT